MRDEQEKTFPNTVDFSPMNVLTGRGTFVKRIFRKTVDFISLKFQISEGGDLQSKTKTTE